MGALADATKHPPFSNGTERYAWEAVWCAYCEHDHEITHGGDGSEGCALLAEVDLYLPSEGFNWPEAWLPEPPGRHCLPSMLVCGSFKPCHRGACTGDPGASERAEREAEVREAWRA